jgi:hypothetical protein
MATATACDWEVESSSPGDQESRPLFTSSRQAAPIGPRADRSIWPLLLLLILTNLAMKLYELPLNRVIEQRLCAEHYTRHSPSAIEPDGTIPEKLCKIDEVQKQLAWLQGIMETTLVVCGRSSDVLA